MTDQIIRDCPRCGGTMILDATHGVYTCEGCAHRLYETLEEAQERLRKKRETTELNPLVPDIARAHLTTYSNDVSQRARSIYDSAVEAVRQGRAADAIAGFHKALELEHDYIDAHLWIARLSDDPKVKRNHISEVIAYDPGNLDAMRLLMVLDGKLTQEQADRIARGEQPEIHAADGAVRVQAQKLKCPACGGALTTDETGARVFCAFCGHSEPLEQGSATDGDSLFSMAMLQRKSQPVQWIIGERMLHCEDCGADRTLTAGMINSLSSVCPFCGSKHVVQQDALSSIDTPDGLIPFSVSADDAKQAVRDSLKGVGERIISLFDDNRIASATLDGCFLPYWIFDAQLEVSRTESDEKMDRSVRQITRDYQPYRNTRMRDALYDLHVPAFKNQRELARKIDDFDFAAAIPFEQGLIARYPAALYEIDFEQASFDAREQASRVMRRRYGTPSSSEHTVVSVSTLVLQMSFRLLLLPFWIATLIERDGDLRTAMINGQTGKTALGKSR